LVYNHKVLKRISRALSTAVQLLLTQQKQQQKRKHKPAAARVQDGAADVVTHLVAALLMFVEAWPASSLADRQDADRLQIALQVAESGAR
jgi:hypothetical protein